MFAVCKVSLVKALEFQRFSTLQPYTLNSKPYNLHPKP